MGLTVLLEDSQNYFRASTSIAVVVMAVVAFNDFDTLSLDVVREEIDAISGQVREQGPGSRSTRIGVRINRI